MWSPLSQERKGEKWKPTCGQMPLETLLNGGAGSRTRSCFNPSALAQSTSAFEPGRAAVGGAEWSGWSGWSGAERSGAERGGVERGERVERGGVEWMERRRRV